MQKCFETETLKIMPRSVNEIARFWFRLEVNFFTWSKYVQYDTV